MAIKEDDRKRIDKETLSVEEINYDIVGKCYNSKDEYDALVAINDAWLEFTKHVDKYRWNSPAGVTVEKIAQARSLLFGE